MFKILDSFPVHHLIHHDKQVCKKIRKCCFYQKPSCTDKQNKGKLREDKDSRTASVNREKNKYQVYNQDAVKQNFSNRKILFVLQFIPPPLLMPLLAYSSAIHI
jgi:hypothetical protein